MSKSNIKIFDKLGLVLLIVLAFVSTGFTLYAIQKYFYQEVRDEISIFDVKDYPEFNVVKTNGNNLTKQIFPLNLPNLSPSTTASIINIEHTATLNAPNFKIEIPMYLKVKNHFDTLGTFTLSENDFSLERKCDFANYDDANRPQMILKDKKGQIKIDYRIESNRVFKNHSNKLELVSIYELVDKQGNSFEGSTPQITKNVIKLTN
ncbi:conserved hypothetical protein [Candidatus Phytoplasma mali]|uniref:Uncharacterized protein n=1 Tax=Phytoplasma mali (strain AT) TaxID=482235 RepID=B3QZI4_PHYMT|nr:hypothetical protein [Candidatus Phytoplasma mali]CAP18591.1 conserved hypothetical protein [Candidatus Phytoplasma mali]